MELRIERALPGRSVGGRCVKPSPANRARSRCTRYRTLAGSLAAPGAAGANQRAFHGRLAGHRLSPGRYRLRAAVPGAAPARVAFRVLREAPRGGRPRR